MWIKLGIGLEPGEVNLTDAEAVERLQAMFARTTSEELLQYWRSAVEAWEVQRAMLTIGAPLIPPRSHPTLHVWDREQVRAQIEEATGQPLSVGDPLPDAYMATAQDLGMEPRELTLWIYESGKQWTQAGLAAWARRYGFARDAEGVQIP